MKKFLKSWTKYLILSLTFFLFSCATKEHSDSVSWYVNPKENDSQNLYGVAYGANLEEATKAALADAAAKLNVSISSNSTLLREEDRYDVNEENRQKIAQIIEKVEFGNFKVSKSKELNNKLFVEVKINRDNFVKNQKESIAFLEEKIGNLEKTLNTINPVQKRITLLKLVDCTKEVELKSRILNGTGENIDLKNILNLREKFENQLNLLSNKIEFYLDVKSTKEMAQLIKNALTKENLFIAKSRISKANQIILSINSSSKNEKIYSAYLVKLYVDFENYYKNQTIAASSIEVMGSSVIDEKQAYLSALKSLESKINEAGILTIIGITN